VLDSVLGQDIAVSYLRKVVEGKITSPLLLVGTEGVGRKFSVLEMIKEMVFSKGGPSAVLQVAQGAHPDVMVVAPPLGKELGVEAVREVTVRSGNFPSFAPNRFFVLDGADRMTSAAANALLKTIEEPPARSLFFLLAESFDQVIPTIRSRCGRVPYQKLPESLVLERISKFEKDPDKALVYSRMGEGSLGRSFRYWGSGKIQVRDQAFSVLHSSVQREFSTAFSTLDECKDLPLLLKLLTFLVHDLMTYSVDPSRVMNQDILEDLTSLRVSQSILQGFWFALKEVWERNESSYVNLPFQLKSSIASSFVGK
jgi:DNA polymerase-3 subunit delta'